MEQIELLAHFLCYSTSQLSLLLHTCLLQTKEEMPFNIFRRQVLIDLLKAKSSKNMKENPPRVSLILIFLKLAFCYENINTENQLKRRIIFLLLEKNPRKWVLFLLGLLNDRMSLLEFVDRKRHRRSLREDSLRICLKKIPLEQILEM